MRLCAPRCYIVILHLEVCVSTHTAERKTIQSFTSLRTRNCFIIMYVAQKFNPNFYVIVVKLGLLLIERN